MAQNRRPAPAVDPKTRQAHERGRAGCARIHELSNLASGQAALHQSIERLNGEIVGIFPNETAIRRLVGAILLEQNDEWAVQRARYLTLETIAPISDNPIVRVACRGNLTSPALAGDRIQKLHHASGHDQRQPTGDLHLV
jgi:putative transposase